MKAVRYCVVLTAVAGFLSVCVHGGIEPQPTAERPLLIARPHPALMGIDGFRAVLFRSGADPNVDGLDWTQLKTDVTDRLAQANIKLIAGPADTFVDVPELRVYFNLLKLGDLRQYVFRIQTSVARPVCLKEHEHPVFKADLWRLKPTFEAVSLADMPARITEVVFGQIGAFIRAYKTANPQSAPASEMTQTDSSAIAQGQAGPAPIAPRAGHGYVASNSSDVFHKPGCRWAKNISRENLLVYQTREQALRAGKRPCKWCKP
ncbi:MAG: Ada metal-binding domain-containing protein [Sedimentisphaerales bacterium]|jgi:hypothetical protein